MKEEVKKLKPWITSEEVLKILKKDVKARNYRDNVILFGFSMRYPILKGIYSVLLLDNYIDLINKL